MTPWALVNSEIKWWLEVGSNADALDVCLLANGFQFSRKLRFSEVTDQEPSSGHNLPNTTTGYWYFPCD